MKEKQTNKNRILGVIILALAIVAFVVGYQVLKPSTTQGEKQVTLVVVSADESEKNYEVQTDAAYLQGVMDEAEGLEYSGEESEFGMMIDTVNGETASFETDGAFWGFFVNDEFCNYGIGEQPVEDGDEFKIVYTIAE
jgi:hypothetical protein